MVVRNVQGLVLAHAHQGPMHNAAVDQLHQEAVPMTLPGILQVRLIIRLRHQSDGGTAAIRQ